MTLATVEEIYETPLTEDSLIEMVFKEDKSVQERVNEAKDLVDRVVEEKRRNMGALSGVEPIDLTSAQALALRVSIRRDRWWQDGFREIVGSLAPEVKGSDLGDLMKAIRIPWWNKSLVFREGAEVGDVYSGVGKGSLEIKARFSHSYITQLARSGNLDLGNQDSASISNVLVTKDGLLVLGYRGGHTFSDMLMVVPAGSVEYHSGKNPLFETFYAELNEELGLRGEHLDSVSLIGRVFDNTLSSNSLYVFETKTSLSFREVMEVWSSSVDRKEHKYLVPLVDEADKVLEIMGGQVYDPSKEDKERPSKTTLENVGAIVPPAAVSLLTHYALREGMDWARKAELELGPNYLFECFV